MREIARLRLSGSGNERRRRRRAGNLMLVVPQLCTVAVSRRGMIMVASPRNPRVMDHDLWYTTECPVMR
ncbi:unnamed protein product [Lasius platythorax]|uniref:Uncharacterized protein n=1 Tax=Lasius platythorax TaxID=488582 RepID=A0AAV2P840_9HYME